MYNLTSTRHGVRASAPDWSWEKRLRWSTSTRGTRFRVIFLTAGAGSAVSLACDRLCNIVNTSHEARNRGSCGGTTLGTISSVPDLTRSYHRARALP